MVCDWVGWRCKTIFSFILMMIMKFTIKWRCSIHDLIVERMEKNQFPSEILRSLQDPALGYHLCDNVSFKADKHKQFLELPGNQVTSKILYSQRAFLVLKRLSGTSAAILLTAFQKLKEHRLSVHLYQCDASTAKIRMLLWFYCFIRELGSVFCLVQVLFSIILAWPRMSGTS